MIPRSHFFHILLYLFYLVLLGFLPHTQWLPLVWLSGYPLVLWITLGNGSRLKSLVKSLLYLSPFLVLTLIVWTLADTKNGFILGLILCYKILLLASFGLLYSQIWQRKDWIWAIDALPLPRSWKQLFILFSSQIFRMIFTTKKLLMAFKLRSGKQPLPSPRQAMSLLARLFLRLESQADTINKAMLLRGYTGSLPLFRNPHLLQKSDLVSLLFWTLYGLTGVWIC